MISIVWDGFPQYGARCVKALVEKMKDETVVVIGRRPAVPDKGMEALCGCRVVWIEDSESRGIDEICGEMPRFISISGWKMPIYDRWRDEVRDAGGIAVCGSDNNCLLDGSTFGFHGLVALIKTIIGVVRFRMMRKNKYDGAFVPGKSGRRLFRLYGVGNERVAEGLYSADATLYSDGLPLQEREKRIIYVGQFIHRKNVVRMVNAFEAAVRKSGCGWALELYGCGALRSRLDSLAMEVNNRLAKYNARVEINDFVQAEQLASLYKRSRVFCLPSLEEHWGLVVHEAALSGCILLLSRTIGAGSDLLGEKVGDDRYSNGFTFDPYSAASISDVMRLAMIMDNASLEVAHAESLRCANAVSIDGYVTGISKLMKLKRL